MLDFLFRRGNPTNRWQRSSELRLMAALAVPALNGVTFGSSIDQLSPLGRNDDVEFGTLCYYDLGVGIDCKEDGTLNGFTVVVAENEGKFRPFRGTLTWNEDGIQAGDLRQEELQRLFGEWYWLDVDESESLAFFEYPNHEMQVEIGPSGDVRRLILTRDRLMSNPDQRESYGVDKPWPPRHAQT